MLGDCTTVDSPVSSMLHTLSSVNFQDLSVRSQLSKNSITSVLLNAVAQKRLVLLGLRIVRFLCHFIKPCNQSIPAILLSVLLLEIYTAACHNRMPADGFVYMSFRNSDWNIQLYSPLISTPGFH